MDRAAVWVVGAQNWVQTCGVSLGLGNDNCGQHDLECKTFNSISCNPHVLLNGYLYHHHHHHHHHHPWVYPFFSYKFSLITLFGILLSSILST
jgi:hypothetical protein